MKTQSGNGNNSYSQWNSFPLRTVRSQDPVFYYYYPFLAGVQPRFRSWGFQFLGLGYYYPSTEKIDRSTQFGAVGYIITLYSSKSYVKSWRSVQILGRPGPHPPTPSGWPMFFGPSVGDNNLSQLFNFESFYHLSSKFR